MSLNDFDAALQKKGYGTLDSAGHIINLDNYWRKDGSTVEHDTFWFIDKDAATYWQNGFKVHYEDYYQPQDRAPFSPLPDNIMTQEGGFIALLLFYMAAKQPVTFRAITKAYIDSVESIVAKILDSGKASPYAAINAHTVAGCVLHRMGLVTDGGYLKIVDQSRNVISVMQQLAAAGKVLEGLQTFVEGSKATTSAGEFGISQSRQGLGLLADTKATYSPNP